MWLFHREKATLHAFQMGTVARIPLWHFPNVHRNLTAMWPFHHEKATYQWSQEIT
jgi:hypothetical protein